MPFKFKFQIVGLKLFEKKMRVGAKLYDKGIPKIIQKSSRKALTRSRKLVQKPPTPADVLKRTRRERTGKLFRSLRVTVSKMGGRGKGKSYTIGSPVPYAVYAEFQNTGALVKGKSGKKGRWLFPTYRAETRYLVKKCAELLKDTAKRVRAV